MARKTGADAARIYRAAEQVVSRCLRGADSLFTPGQGVWSRAVITDLHERFVQRPDESRDDFETKFSRQLAGAPHDTIQLAGEILYLHFLVTVQLRGETKRSQIRTVLSWSDQSVTIPTDLGEALDGGLCHAGQSFNRHRPFLLMYLVTFAQRLKVLDDHEVASTLNDPWAFKAFVFDVPAHAARIQQHALIHLVHPDTFEPIVSETHKRWIVDRLGDSASTTDDLDRNLFEIRQRLTPQYGELYDYYDEALRTQWNVVQEEPQATAVREVRADERPTRYWVERSLVAGRPDRLEGVWALGQAIWSPQRGEDGRDIYRLMREVRPGDVVLHFIDNRHFVGVSTVASEAQMDREPPPGTAWSGRPCIKYPLAAYTSLTPPIGREALFVDPDGQTRVREILKQHRGLFFNRDLELNQGAYLTEAPTALLKFLDEVYRQASGHGLPHVSFDDVLPEVMSKPPALGRALTLDWLAEQTLWPKERLLEVIEALESSSPQVILAGPPGTGKTWVAQLLARYLTQDQVSHHRLVQFHPSYAYETFMQGLRPVAERGAIQFTVVPGVVLSIVDQLRGDDRTFVLVVDEMNRANLPKVFGELMYLLEYRDHRIDLPYTTDFRLPPNLRFIGTMNTADRSIRSIDIALRRRFDLFECQPDAEVLRRYLATRENRVDSLIDGFQALNEELVTRLDRHHTIGHTFFMVRSMTPDVLLRIWRRKIGPLLEEYFFDQPDVAASFDPGRLWPELQ